MAHYWATSMPVELTSPKDISPGDYYESCFYHPCVCTEVDISDEGREAVISGVSLVDGHFPCSCSFIGCRPRKLSFEEAMRWKFFGPPDAELPLEEQWWTLYPCAPSFLEDSERQKD